MSVIVKGMEMPDTCEECQVSCEVGSDLHCQLTDDGNKWGWKKSENGFESRHDWCPLRPLPKKHGRLGDLDELQALFRECIDECKKWIQEVEDGGDVERILIARQSFNTFVEASLRTRKIPTIVEAEGDDS